MTGLAENGGTNDKQTDDDDNNGYHDAGQVVHLMPLMVFFPVFWMLYDQQGSVWTLQATRLQLHGLQPEQLQFLNPLEIMILIPFLDRMVYPWMYRYGWNIQPFRRMEYGMALASMSFFASAILEYNIRIQLPNTISLTWQIPQITILTVAEILLNITGLEFVYSQAPSNMQAVILAMVLFMTAVGDCLGAFLFATVFSQLSMETTMVVCALCMIINLIFFSRVVQKWKPFNMANQGEEREEEDNNKQGLQLVGVIGNEEFY
jgi:POT family proton-dependent oligopeptide transporter